jgi:tetratricopeptide (TPR) repeat protein
MDKHSLLPGQNWDIEIKKAIKSSRYFITLSSANSVGKRGVVQTELKRALDAQEEFPESAVFIIPVRLDDCHIGYEKLEQIHYVDLFPDWKEGFQKILQTIKYEEEKNVESVTVDQLKNKLEKAVVNLESALTSSKFVQFKGEKEFFVGRHDYLNNKIKNAIKDPGARVSIIGPGGSGKSQLAFKAIHQYEKEGIFDVVIPAYFDITPIPLSEFLSNLAEGLGIPPNELDKYDDIDDRKNIVRNTLSQKHHPLIYLDNYETISYQLNAKSKQPSQSAIDISNFLNDSAPGNVSILLTSRERNNRLREKEQIDLEGLDENESKELFNGLVIADPLLRNSKDDRTRNLIDDMLRKTGGHPLSIELIAKNITSVEELEEISDSLGMKEVDWAAPEERFRSLEACFGYTIDKLDPTLRGLLPNLTIFKSPFPISAAVQILGVDKRNIMDLYNRSLLTRIESDHQYGRIDDPDYLLYSIHTALLNYVQNLANEATPNLEHEYGEKYAKYYYDLIDITYNSFGTDEHLKSLARFRIIFQGETNDLDKAVEITSNQMLKAEILRGLSQTLFNIGIFTNAFEYCSRSLEIHKDLNNKEGMANSYKALGIIRRTMGKLDEALDYHKKALDIAKELDDRVGMARDYNNIGNVLTNMGNNKEALVYHSNALEIDKELDDRVGMAGDYNNIGIALRYMDNYQQALDYHKKALDIAKELDDRVGMARDYANIGNVFYGMGNYQQALDYHNKALEIQTDLNDRVGMARDYANIGNVFYGMGNYQQALDYHKKALDIAKELDDRVGMARDYANIGNVFYGMGNYQQALDYHNSGLNILLDLEKSTGYHNPLIETIKQKIGDLSDVDT